MPRFISGRRRVRFGAAMVALGTHLGVGASWLGRSTAGPAGPRLYLRVLSSLIGGWVVYYLLPRVPPFRPWPVALPVFLGILVPFRLAFDCIWDRAASYLRKR